MTSPFLKRMSVLRRRRHFHVSFASNSCINFVNVQLVSRVTIRTNAAIREYFHRVFHTRSNEFEHLQHNSLFQVMIRLERISNTHWILAPAIWFVLQFLGHHLDKICGVVKVCGIAIQESKNPRIQESNEQINDRSTTLASKREHHLPVTHLLHSIHCSRFESNRLSFSLSTCLVGILPSIVETELKADAVNRLLMALVGEAKLEQDILDKTIEVLLKYIKYDVVETRVTVLNWIRHLHSSMPGQLFVHMHQIFPVLLNTLSDTSDEVLLLDLFLISNICQSESAPDQVDVSTFGLNETELKQVSHISPFLIKFVLSLLEMFRTEPTLLRERGVLIIRQLCLLLEPAHIYRVICVLLERESKHNFAQEMVSTLHGVLLTATELFILRDELRALSNESSRSLFECIFRVWSNRPIALLGLCLLSQHYQQAADIALLLSQVDITVDVLLEIDKLVNLVESPVLAYVRMDLLSSIHRPPLCTVLSALLMLLPQSEAFVTLHKRLQAVPALVSIDNSPYAPKVPPCRIDFPPLMLHFKAALARRQTEVRSRHRDLLSGVVTQMKNVKI